MWRKALLFLLIEACFLFGSSEAVSRYIGLYSAMAIGSYMTDLTTPDEMIDFIENERQGLGDLDVTGDYSKVEVMEALDSLIQMRQFASEGRCDDDVADLVRAFQVLLSSFGSEAGEPEALKIRSLVSHWIGIIANNCIEGVNERLQEARSRLHPATVEGIEGFLADQFLEQMRANIMGDIRDIDWNMVLDRLESRGQDLASFNRVCEGYLRVMRNQVALTRAVLVRRPQASDIFTKRTLMKISFCELLAQPMMSTGLYEAINKRIS